MSFNITGTTRTEVALGFLKYACEFLFAIIASTPKGTKQDKQFVRELTESEKDELMDAFDCNGGEYSSFFLRLSRSADSLESNKEYLEVLNLRLQAKNNSSNYNAKVKNLLWNITEGRKFNSLQEVYAFGEELKTLNPEVLESQAEAKEKDLRDRGIQPAMSLRTRQLVPEVMQAVVTAMQTGKVVATTPYESFLKSLERQETIITQTA